jgi:hypothetical protein
MRRLVAAAGPVLATVTVKPICEPALTVAESAVLVTVTFGVRITVIGRSNPLQLHFDFALGVVPKRKAVGDSTPPWGHA